MNNQNRRDEDYLCRRNDPSRNTPMIQIQEINWKKIVLPVLATIVIITIVLNWDRIWATITAILISIFTFAGKVLILLLAFWILIKWLFPNWRRRR